MDDTKKTSEPMYMRYSVINNGQPRESPRKIIQFWASSAALVFAVFAVLGATEGNMALTACILCLCVGSVVENW